MGVNARDKGRGDVSLRRVAARVRELRVRREYAALFAVTAAIFAVGVAIAMMRSGITATYEKLVLDCPYEGSGAHTHSESCYDADGNLVCPLEERELHMHDDSCYEKVLACGLDGAEGHEHDKSCYKRVLTCGQEEVTEEHVHGPGCFRTEVVKGVGQLHFESDDFSTYVLAVTTLEQTLVSEGETVSVTVEAPAEASIPATAELQVTEVDPKSDEYETYAAQAEDRLDSDEHEVALARFFDIRIMDDGQEVQPEAPVQVRLDVTDAPADPTAQVNVLHYDDEAEPELVEAAEKDGTAEFETEDFSVWGVIYTVDFHWKANGKNYDFSIPGGGFVALSDLVDLLGIGEGDSPKKQGEGDELLLEDAGTGMDDAAVNDLLEDVESVEFSDPNLVWIGKVEAETTVGRLKQDKGLEVEHSAELTDEQTKEIDAQAVKAGDWALVSLKPFTSEESLTVTMKNGDKFVIWVTDAQVSANVLTADGKTFRITVTYGDDAKIPDGTKLVAKEVKPGSDEYIQHFEKAWAEVNKDYLIAKEEQIAEDGDSSPLTDIPIINFDEIRFFDISLSNNKKEIEPKAPVQVQVTYIEEMKCASSEPVIGVAHFLKKEIELIDQVKVKQASDGDVSGVIYEQSGFSIIGTYVGQKSGNGSAPLKAASMPLLGESSDDDGELDSPNPTKTLVSNDEDGTYTLSLSVDGHQIEKETTDVTKSNVLIVMDRSSSMRHNVATYTEFTGNPQNGVQYYGADGSSHFEITWNYNYLTGQYQWMRTAPYYQYDYWGNPYETSQQQRYTGTVYTKTDHGKTKLKDEQDALKALIESLLSKNQPGETVTDSHGNTVSLDDVVEISVISFADHALSGQNSEVDWTTNEARLLAGINQTNMPSGTNWEDALIYAKRVADAKASQPSQRGEPTYVVFLTDGEPTAIAGETGSARHYDKGTYKIFNDGTEHIDEQKGGFNYALTGNGYNAATNDGKNALDRAKTIVDAGYKFYGIFTYGDGPDQLAYLERLVNYSYGNGDNANSSDALTNRFYSVQNSSELTEAFQNIFSEMSMTQAHAQVKITDGLRQDAMTSTFVNGRPSGVRYTVTPKDDTSLPYTVTATMRENATEPDVTFTIDGTDYTTQSGDVVKRVNPVVAGDLLASYNAGEYYSVTVDGTEYKMALASVDNDGQLVWDLSPIGMLQDNCTYKADFIVWPNQDAYDYVSALNNGLTRITNSKNEQVNVAWDQSAATPVEDSENSTYYTGGCATYPSIVYYPAADDDYPNGVYNGTFAVLTNTDQYLDYSIVSTQDGVITGVEPQDRIPMDLPDPMELEDTKTQIEKQWNVERDPGILAQYLYNADGSSKELKITFNVYQGDNANPYKSVSLGWDDDKEEYVWAEDSPITTVAYAGSTHEIGTRWASEFSISAGLMLSEAQMDALKMDKGDYPSATYDNTTYYILEPGHDYTIEETGNVGYEFDFVAPLYHPMLVDGVMQNVDLAKKGNAWSIAGMSAYEEGLSSLLVENTLRGYINLDKVVVDKDNNEVLTDKTKFEYTITLESPTEPGPFVDTHIPWYGINGLFYHDSDFNYYQVEMAEGGAWVIRNENNDTYPVTSSGFDPDEAEGQEVTFRAGEEEVAIELFGNETTVTDDGKTATATLKITRSETLNIANVPADTTYTITESAITGYDLVGIVKEVKDGDSVESTESVENLGKKTVTGKIVANRDNHVVFTNKFRPGALKLTKVVKSDGATPTSEEYQYVDGDYVFEIASVATVTDGVDTESVTTRYAQITVENGVAASYKVADSREGLASAAAVTGSWAIVSDLLEGDYIITETDERNGLLLTDLARGDGVAAAVDLDEDAVTVHVTTDDTTAVQPHAQTTFTNSYYDNDGPDGIALDITKTFEGLASEADLPDNFGVVLSYTAGDSAEPIEIELKKNQDETIAAGKENIKIKAATSGYTLNWHITNLPSDASNFRIKEANYDSVTGYTFIEATLDGADITETAGDWHELSVDAPQATLTDVTSERHTPDSHADLRYELEDTDILLTKLTANQGTLVISKESLNTVEREAVAKGWPSEGGFKNPGIFFSMEEHPEGFSYGGKAVTFDEADGKTYVTFTSNASAQECVFAVSYDSESSLNNAALANKYTQKTVDLSIVKVDVADVTARLPGASFTIRKIKDTLGANGVEYDGAESEPAVTDNEGKLVFAGLTEGYYEIREKAAPEGYVLEGNGCFYIRVSDGAIHLLGKEAGVDPGRWDIAGATVGNVTYVSENNEAQVSNTPGVALPNSGGAGTSPLCLLGIALMVFAGAGFATKRRGRGAA